MTLWPKEPPDLNKWCRYIVNTSHITAVMIILAHVVWYYAARSVLAKPPDVYLRDYIILPSIGFLIVNSSVGLCIRAPRVPLAAKEYLSLSLFFVFAVYLSLTHDIAKVVLCAYFLPIFASTVFSNLSLTRRIFLMSLFAVLLPGVKRHFKGTLDSDMLMELFVCWMMFSCAYFLAKVLIQYGQDNLKAVVHSREEALKSELAFLQAQIKPHFLYNTINTVVSFCHTDGERAAELLVDFSQYLRLVFDVDPDSITVPLSRELELTRAYLEIEQARFGPRIAVEYEIDPDLTTLEIPSFCIQPLVENAVKHGLCRKDEGGTIRISARRVPGEAGGMIRIQVCDTGAGMSAETLNALRNPGHADRGVGFFSVRRRIELWRNARLEIESTPGSGTCVTITGPAPAVSEEGGNRPCSRP